MTGLTATGLAHHWVTSDAAEEPVAGRRNTLLLE
eukprot:CAMPEP_0181469630 /NCGR_PEP_ID=MMETSP1110-20121109/38122_1 /TAXON_ID=174948 /ORGANISM="Symbiodinium sp., Strain CCMP421" /LENGTH=33 /DNA_ID= /DNA_START= /DNA_END= /DNA_ORIENTATION=